MFDGNGNKDVGHWIVWAGITLLALFLAGNAFWLSRIGDDVNKQAATSQSYRDAQEIFERECTELPSTKEILKCFRESIQDTRQPARNEEDVDAQKQMARAAWAMLFATLAIGLISIGLTIIGVLYIRGTLHYTRLTAEHTQGMLEEARQATEAAQRAADAASETNANAVKAMKADLRPWIKINQTSAHRVFAQKRGLSVSIQCHFQNIGRSPARSVATKGEIIFSERMIVPWEAIRAKAAQYSQCDETYENTIFPSDEDSQVVSLKHWLPKFQKPAYAYVFIVVSYRFDTFPEVHKTCRLYQVSSRRVVDDFPRQRSVIELKPIDFRVLTDDVVDHPSIVLQKANTGDYAD